MKNIYRKLRLAKQCITSIIKSREYLDVFDRVETHCMFLGYPRSGHSLIGSLLDAHPDIIIANELHTFRYIRYRFSKRQLFYLLLDNSQKFTNQGRTHTGYSYAVPNQWQGRFRRLRVIGDKRGSGSVKKLNLHPGLLQQLRRTVGIDMRFIHTVRNPYDNISTIFEKSRRRNLKGSIDYYFFYVKGVINFKKQVADRELIEARHESFIHNP
ncbi:MAG: sulfotransferase, partial [Deltaproteobacteria bacterium]|nr:sulfotransferase [Deltaproteobacteria bacterium]